MIADKSKPKDQKNWFGVEDDTPEHDDLTIQVMDNIEKFILRLSHFKLFDFKMEIERQLPGYPPVFPDVICMLYERSIEDVQQFYWHLDEGGKNGFVFYYFDDSDQICSQEVLFYDENFHLDSLYDPNPPIYGRHEIREKLDKFLTRERLICADLEWYSQVPAYHYPLSKLVGTGRSSQIAFEIKPRITSFGAVMRQVQIYRERLNQGHGGRVGIISNDRRFDEQFEQQGFPVLHPDQILLEVD